MCLNASAEYAEAKLLFTVVIGRLNLKSFLTKGFAIDKPFLSTA